MAAIAIETPRLPIWDLESTVPFTDYSRIYLS
jgi:hypothetical protein